MARRGLRCMWRISSLSRFCDAFGEAGKVPADVPSTAQSVSPGSLGGPQRNQATQTSPSPAHASINLFHRERYHCLCLYYRSGFPSRQLVAERALNQRVIYGAEWEREGFFCLLFWLGSGNSAATSAPKLGNKPNPSVTLPTLPRP